MRDLLADLTTTLSDRRPCVYCVIVETRGSTPQKAGAVMLVHADGSQRGTLGGGCVEAEVRQRALHVLNEPGGRPEVLTFHLDDNYGWDDGLICGGRMSILADPLAAPGAWSGDHAPAHYYARFSAQVEQGRGCTEAVLTVEAAPLRVGDRFLFDAEGRVLAQTSDVAPPDTLLGNLKPLSHRPGPWLAQGVAYLPVLPRVTLLIVGAGHVGQAVAKLAADVDFDVWVMDDRERYLSPERFPMAQRRIVGEVGPTLQAVVAELSAAHFCLVVTRGHSHDEEALYHLAGLFDRPPVGGSPGYVGMIGSKRKIKMIYEDLVAKGVSPEALARVHAPLGLEIGSQTVAEIAVSIVAELIACRNLGTTQILPRKTIVPETTG
jgi:xanthine dehydrogenase accessory factor